MRVFRAHRNLDFEETRRCRELRRRESFVAEVVVVVEGAIAGPPLPLVVSLQTHRKTIHFLRDAPSRKLLFD